MRCREKLVPHVLMNVSVSDRSFALSLEGKIATMHLKDKQLEKAIRDVKNERLVDNFLKVCADVPAAAKLASNMLLTPSHEASAKPRGYSDTVRTAQKSRLRWVICENCKKEFDFSDNASDAACVYHPGTRIHFYL